MPAIDRLMSLFNITPVSKYIAGITKVLSGGGMIKSRRILLKFDKYYTKFYHKLLLDILFSRSDC